MKKVLSKLTGLSIVLAMVFNLFMPMMVSAAPTVNQFLFKADSGTWTDGEKRDKSEDWLIDAGRQAGKLTEEQVKILADSECLKTSDCICIGWQNTSTSDIYKTQDDLRKLSASSGGIELDPIWGKVINIKVKRVIDDNRESENDFQHTLKKGDSFYIKKDTVRGAWDALQFDNNKYTLTNYTATGGGLGRETTFNTLNLLENNPFGNDQDVTIKVNLKIKKFTVTCYNNIGDSSKKEVAVTYGDKLADLKLEPEVTKPEHKFAGWYTDADCKNECDLNAPITDNMTIYAKWVKIYKILPGGNNNIDIQKGMDLVVRADGELTNFSKLYVDDNLVDPSNYTLAKGSTIVTLKASYLDTLPPGEHTIKFVYTDGGEAVTKFKTVAGDDASVSDTSSGSGSSGSGSSGSPKTGDAGIAMWGILLSVSLVGAAASIRCFRKAK